MTLDEDQCWDLLRGARHGVLATVNPARGVDALPVVFAVLPGRTIVIPIDTLKPKRSLRLQRLANIQADPRCVLMIDRYAEEWSQLWWVQVHGRATVFESPDAIHPALADRYPQYSTPGSVVSVIALDPTDVRGWSGSDGVPS